MFSIIEHIEYLMSRHDCVAIPGFGAFIANDSPASYHEGQAVMERPRRAIGFNALASHNDGLLVQSIMRREGLDYDAAMRFIADSVTTFRQQLSKGSEVSMGRLGYFRSNEDRIEFNPFLGDEACDRYYGLADFSIKTVSTLEQETDEQEVGTAIVPDDRNLFSRKAVRIAASVAVLLGLGVVLSTPIIVDRSHEMASLSPEVSAPQAQQLGSVTVKQGVVPGAFETVENHPAIAAVGNTAGKYYMVIATLRNQQELDSFKAKYADLVPYMKMLDYKGYTCVYVARSDDYGTLMDLRSELPDRLRDVWIYN